MPKFSYDQKGAIHLVLPLLILTIISGSVLITSNIPSTTKYDSNVAGILIAKGGDDNRGSSGNSNSNKDSSDRNDNSDKSGRGSSEEIRVKHEIRTSDERVKTEVREDRSRIDIYQGGTKTRIQQKENEILIKTELEEDDGATDSAEEDDSEIVQELRAISKFPLRIDTSTNQLIMTKNGVERVLTVLPAHAVANMLRAHLKKGLGPKFFSGATASASPSATPIGTPSASASPSASPSSEPEATESAELTIAENEITLEERNSQVVYKVPAKKHLKIFGLFPVTTNLTGFVSAENGSLIEEQQSLLARILDFLSP